MKRASIDLGTNTCLLLIEEISSEIATVLHDESNVVRLGQGVDKTGEFNPEAMERAKKCLIQYASIAKKFGVDPKTILAVGTAQARDSRNSKAFFESVEAACGIRFRILTGDEEAKATFLGAAIPGIKTSQMVVLDIGGGSTELVAMPDASAKIFGESVNIGAVRMTERYLKSDPVTDDEFWKCEDAINQSIDHLLPWRKSLPEKMNSEPVLVAVAGTAVTLAMLQESMTSYRREAIDGMILTQGDVHRLVEELKWRSISERQAMPGMEVKRADVLLAGALIFWRVMEVLDFKEVRISTRGLRYGVFEL
jgi:exopolyphosphatase/guanosine-5'-triphosphate,3'-diphosphate pyrophosphatase